MTVGKAVVKGNKLCFDEVGWKMVKDIAKRQHKTPKQVVLAGIKRSIKQGYFSEKLRNV